MGGKELGSYDQFIAWEVLPKFGLPHISLLEAGSHAPQSRFLPFKVQRVVFPA